MTTYRTGNNWHRHTIIRVGTKPPDAQGRREDDQPVAWVDSAAPEGLAERICALLTRDESTPDVTYVHGARDALAEVAERIADLDGTVLSFRAVRQVLEAAAAELGVDEDAASARLSSPQSDLQGSVVAQPTPGCPEPAWDGPYRMPCGRGGATGNCPTHGAFQRGDA